MLGKRILCCSDIHGCWDKFKTAMDANHAGYHPDSDQLILLGDYIDRGSDSRKVVEAVIRLQQKGAIVLRGNHEDLCISALSGEAGAMELWMRNGGDKTLDSYEGNQDALDKHVEWMKILPRYYETEHYIFVHASPKPRVPMNEQSGADLTWGRHNSEVGLGKLVVHGHTPVRMPVAIQDQLFIDTAAVFNGKLTVIALSDIEQEWRVVAAV